MNRIRKYGKMYQVLLTPEQINNTTFEFLIGNWTDDRLRNYYILDFDTLAEAQCEAFKHPDLDWNKMVLAHKSAYHDIKDILKDIIDTEKYIVEFVPKFKDGEMVKDTMFNRVMAQGKRFTLMYNMND